MDVPDASAAVWRAFGVLTTVDIIVIALVLVSMGIGFMTGFVWQFVRIASLVVSIWISWVYHPVVAESLSSGLSQPVRRIIGAFVVFLAALMVFYLLAFLFRDVINALKPELPDRILGAGFGLLKAGLLIGVAAFLTVHYLGPDNPVRTHVQSSKSAMATVTCVRAFLYVLPDSVSDSPDEPFGNRAVSDETRSLLTGEEEEPATEPPPKAELRRRPGPRRAPRHVVRSVTV